MKYKLTLMMCMVGNLWASAQQRFSIDEALTYALQNHASAKNAAAGVNDAELQIKELKASGLPQINGSFGYTYNAIIPVQIIKASTFDPTAPEGAVTKFKLGVPWGGQAALSLNQLIFDASYLVGLRAAETYRLMASQDQEKSKITIAETVKKAYYTVMVSQQRANIMTLNIQKLDSIIYQTEQYYKQGFVEKLDIDRLNVQKNNLITENTKLRNLINLSVQMLKFQMGYPISSPITLTEKLDDTKINLLRATVIEEVNPENRIEYQQIVTSKKLTNLNIERYQKGYLPSVFLSANLGAAHSNITFNPFERWFGLSSLSLGMKVPIYDSGLRKTQVARQKLNMLKIDNGAAMLKQSFELENENAKTNIKNGFESLEIQKRNMELAEDIVNTTKIKYKQGLGSNLEIINAENDLKQAQNNYFSTLYDLLIAKVDLDKAQGNLLKK